MLIVGTGGLARDVITSWELDETNKTKQLFLFDNINLERDFLYNKYRILHTFDEVKELFDTGEKDFFVCIGNPLKRMRMAEKFERLGGNLIPFVSCRVSIVSPDTPLGKGVIIEPGVVVSKDVILEKGVLIDAGSIIGHDAVLREYATISPGVKVLGRVEIGAYSYIGANTVILPDVKIGDKVRISEGKIIDKDVPGRTKMMD